MVWFRINNKHRRKKTVCLWTVGWKRRRQNTRTRGIRCEPDGKPLLWLPHDKTWIPDLPKGSDNYRFGWIRDTPIRLQIQRNEPFNLSTTNPLAGSAADTWRDGGKGYAHSSCNFLWIYTCMWYHRPINSINCLPVHYFALFEISYENIKLKHKLMN